MFGLHRDRIAKAVAVVGLVVMTTALAACGGGGGGSGASTSVAATPAGGAPSGSDPQFAWELKFTKCLRTHGIEIADPDPVNGAPSVVHDEAYATASKACEAKLGDPPSAAGKNGNNDDGQVSKVLLKEVQCLRDHGLDVKDPSPREALQIPEGADEDVVNACFASKGK
jgi:hypothetical protein